MATEEKGPLAPPDPNYRPGSTVDGKPIRSAIRVEVPLLPGSPVFNANTVFDFENEWFKGRVLPIIKNSNSQVPAWFHDKKRQYEVQVQGKFKKQPEGELWFGAEISKPMQLSFMRRTACKVMLSFVTAFGRGVQQSWGESGIEGDDKPHLIFPLLSAMDCYVVTPPGEKPPDLGNELKATPRRPRRPSSEGSAFSLDNIYTMSYYSRFVDFETWNVCQLPGLGTLEIDGFFDERKIQFVAYALPKGAPHLTTTRTMIFGWNFLYSPLEERDEKEKKKKGAKLEAARPSLSASAPATPQRGSPTPEEQPREVATASNSPRSTSPLPSSGSESPIKSPARSTWC